MTKLLVAMIVAVGIGSISAADGPKYFNDYNKGLAEARATGKPMITIFSASWCGPCLKMKKRVYPSKEVAPFHDSFVWAYLDSDSGKNRPLKKQFQVTAIPHITFVSADGEVIDHLRGAVEPAAFAGVLSATLAKSPKIAPVPQSPGEPTKKGIFGIFKKKQ